MLHEYAPNINQIDELTAQSVNSDSNYYRHRSVNRQQMKFLNALMLQQVKQKMDRNSNTFSCEASL